MNKKPNSKIIGFPFESINLKILLLLIFVLVFSTVIALILSIVSYNNKKALDLISKQREMTFETIIAIHDYREATLLGDEIKAEQVSYALTQENGLLDRYIYNTYNVFDKSVSKVTKSAKDETVVSNSSILLEDLKKFVDDIKLYLNNPTEEVFKSLSEEADKLSMDIAKFYDTYYNRYLQVQILQKVFSLIAIFATIIASVIVIKSYYLIKNLEYLATNDKLTGLRNLISLEEYSKTLSSKKYAVVFIDIDGFKKINQKYGSYIGNELIGELGKRVNKIFSGHFCCRYGGDEFLVLLELENDFPINKYLIRLYEEFLSVYVDTNGSIHEVTASIGIIGCDVDKENVNTSIEWASLAMQSSKKSLTDRFCYIKNNEEKALLNI